MAEALAATAVSQVIPQTASLITDRPCTVTLRFTGLASISDRSFALGTKTTPPATFGGLTHVITAPLPLTEWAGATQVGSTPGGGWTVVCRQTGLDISAASVGEHLYALLFPIETPISGTVPDLVVDLGEIF